MYTHACSLCSATYCAETERAFCDHCVDRVNADARAAETHMNRIRAGDMKTEPANERERTIRDSARRAQLSRLT